MPCCGSPPPAEVSAWVALLNATTTKAQAVDGFINSPEFIGNANGTFAAAYHTAYAIPDHLNLAGNGLVWSQQLVTVSYTNTYGPSDIAYGQVLVSRTQELNGSNACYVIWDNTGNLILTGEAIHYGHTGENDPQMENPQCSVNGEASHITPTATGHDVTLALTFKPPFTGDHTVWSFGLNNENLASAWAPLGDITITAESVSAPAIQNGPANGTTGASYTYTAGGAASSFGHSLQYQFNWGDGTSSGWISAASAAHVWAAATTYAVTVQARCAAHPDVVSGISGGLSVTIVTPPPPDFTITGSTLTASMVVGGISAHYSLTVTPINGFTGVVTLTPAGLPAGTTVSPASVTISGVTPVPVDLVVTPPPTAPPITSAFTITAAAPPLSPHLIGGLSLALQDFRIDVSPQNPVTNYTGTAWSPATLVYFITATGVNGFNGNISLTYTNQGHVPCAQYNVNSTTLTVASIVSYTVNMGTCTALPNWYTVVNIDGQSGGVHRTGTAGIGLNESAPESISTPSISTGASSGSAGTNYTYTASVGASSFGHAVEYQFTWGDGTSSAWLSAPVATHAWSGTAIYTVFVQARCATDHSVVSTLSSGYTVNLTGSTTYTLSGQVQQPNGSGIGGTILAARDGQNTLITTVISDASGNYALSLPPGTYTVTATSPFGAFSPATLSYDLSDHRSGQNRRLATMNMAPETPPPDHGPERNYIPVPNTGGPRTAEFWYMGADDDARNTSSCRVEPAAGVTAQFNRPTDAQVVANSKRYFTITFTAQPSAALGNRDIICRYGNQDIVGITGITVYDGTPHINSISPAYGIAGLMTGLTVSGSNLDGVTSLKISGNSCPGPQCLLSATIAGEITSVTVPVSISIDSAALSGTYQLSVVSTMLESNSWPYTVADKPPTIASVTQTALEPGQPGTIVIYGQNFGSCLAGLPCGGAQVTSCAADAPTCNSTDLTGSVTSWSPTEITLTLSASATSEFTPGEYQLQVISPGIAGQGFVSTPQTGSISNRGNFVLTSNPNVTLEVRSETSIVPELTPGNQNTTASCAWITPTPSMPNLTVKVNGGTAAGTVSYRLETYWTWINRNVQTKLTWPETDLRTIPQNGFLSTSGDSGWTVPWPTSCGPNGNSPCFYGGWATLRWRYQTGPQQTATNQRPYVFKICGRNPTENTALQYINSVMSDPTKYWFAEKLALHETAVSQFCQPGRTISQYCSASGNANEGWPLLGEPAGYGILQRDPLPKTQADLPEQIMWNWKTAVTSGKDHIDATAGQPVENGSSAEFVGSLTDFPRSADRSSERFDRVGSCQPIITTSARVLI